VKPAIVFSGVALLAALAGTALWLGERSTLPASSPPRSIAPAALHAATFRDDKEAPRSLGEFAGRVLVINFWATWCAPCRTEMPAFSRVNARWSQRGVAFVGLSAEAPEAVRRFGAEVPVSYALWTGAEAESLGKRLGNRLGVLPFTAILDPAGNLLEVRVGPYTEEELEQRLQAFASNSPQRR
jgi:thiol-disulfide isomerase/thioredoxin